MKIAVQSDRMHNNTTYHLVQELKRRNMLFEGKAEDCDIVFNVDSIHNVGFVKGKKLSIYYEVDDFLSFGRNTQYYDQADILYIVHPEYAMFYPPNVKILRVAANPDFHKEDPTVAKEFDYVFVGAIEPLPVYNNRLAYLDKCFKTTANMAVLWGRQEDYARNMSRGHVILDVLPQFPHNGNVCIHLRVYEAMATGCLMIDDHPFLRKIFQKDVHYVTYDKFGHITMEEIARIKKASRELILAKHTWKHRIDQVIKDINEKLKT